MLSIKIWYLHREIFNINNFASCECANQSQHAKASIPIPRMVFESRRRPPRHKPDSHGFDSTNLYRTSTATLNYSTSAYINRNNLLPSQRVCPSTMTPKFGKDARKPFARASKTTQNYRLPPRDPRSIIGYNIGHGDRATN